MLDSNKKIYSVEEMAKEQLYFLNTDKEVISMVHEETEKEYYAYELAINYIKNHIEELEEYKTIKQENEKLKQENEKLKQENEKQYNELYKFKKNQKGRKEKFSAEQKEKIIELHNKGLSNCGIAKEYKCSEGTIRKIIKQKTD